MTVNNLGNFLQSSLACSPGVQILPDPGTAAFPPFGFFGDANTGMFSVGANIPAMAGNGVELCRFVQGPTNSISLDGGVTYLNQSTGPFTPSLSFGGSSTGITYFSVGGQYLKIGLLVYCTFVMSLSNQGTAVGSAAILGLPFPASSALSVGSYITISAIQNMTLPVGTIELIGTISPLATIMNLYVTVPSTTVSPADDTMFTNFTTLNVSFVYAANS